MVDTRGRLCRTTSRHGPPRAGTTAHRLAATGQSQSILTRGFAAQELTLEKLAQYQPLNLSQDSLASAFAKADQSQSIYTPLRLTSAQTLHRERLSFYQRLPTFGPSSLEKAPGFLGTRNASPKTSTLLYFSLPFTTFCGACPCPAQLQSSASVAPTASFVSSHSSAAQSQSILLARWLAPPLRGHSGKTQLLSAFHRRRPGSRRR